MCACVSLRSRPHGSVSVRIRSRAALAGGSEVQAAPILTYDPHPPRTTLPKAVHVPRLKVGDDHV